LATKTYALTGLNKFQHASFCYFLFVVVISIIIIIIIIIIIKGDA
jgi:hypothetical protein